MATQPTSHHRSSIRLSGYDYAQAGAYFVTLVTQRREPLFGGLVDGEMHLTEIGRIAQEEWFRTADLRPNVHLEPDEFIVMPNHIHGIIWIVEPPMDGVSFVGAQRRCAPTDPVGSPMEAQRRYAPTGNAPTENTSLPHVVAGSLAAIIRAYKSAVTYRVNALQGSRGAPLWQRNYYEHILRSDADLDRVRAYILANPRLWERDSENPAFTERNS